MKVITEVDFKIWMQGMLMLKFIPESEWYKIENSRKCSEAAKEILRFIHEYGVYETTEVEKLQDLIEFLKKELEKK